MKNNVETQLRRLLRKTSGLDIMVLRLSVIFIFALFGTYKWFAFEANALHHRCQAPGSVRYPALGVQGLSYALGVVENITLLALIAGFFRPAVAGRPDGGRHRHRHLSLLPQLGRIDSFIIKDVLLIGAGLVLLRHDLRRTLINRRAKQLSAAQTRSSDALSAMG
jgi:uncharacterized membrane protein YkgB